MKKLRGPFNVLHDAHATRVSTSRDHANVSDLELDVLDGLASLKVDLDRVVHLPHPNSKDNPIASN